MISDKDKVELRYDLRFEKILSIKTRHKFIEQLYEPFKIRGDEEDILKDQPKYIYPNLRDGHVIRTAVDQKGFFAIFQPEFNDYEKIKIFANIENKRKQLAEIAILQSELRNVGNSEDQLEEIEKKIENLFQRVLGSNILHKNPHPDIFFGETDSSYRLFKTYSENYIIDTHLDYSFIYQQLKKDQYLHPISHRVFKEFLWRNKFITDKQNQVLSIKGQFYSLTKSTNANRLNNYNNIKEEILAGNS